MKWFTLHGALRDHAKWVGLSMDERGAWITLMTIGHGAEPRWMLGKRDHVVALLHREGAANPEQVLDALVDARLLDEDEKGEMSMHDAAEWQRKPSDAPEAAAARKRESRARHAESRLVTPTDRQTDKTDWTNSERDQPATPAAPIPLDGNLYEVFERLTGIPATVKDKADIDAMCARWDRLDVRRAMYSDPSPGRNPDRFIGRLWHRLKESAA